MNNRKLLLHVIYVYCSNESPVDVFFDNLQVVHGRGPVLEETHYYPFGLTMAGISSKANSFGGLENKYLFNDGSELQEKEFSDGSGLNIYETKYRGLDPQLGRFWQSDPLSQMSYNQSLYSYADNNLILLNDVLGLAGDTMNTKTSLSTVVVKAQPKIQVFIWSKAAVGKDVGHTAIRIDNNVYGYYPTS